MSLEALVRDTLQVLGWLKYLMLTLKNGPILSRYLQVKLANFNKTISHLLDSKVTSVMKFNLTLHSIQMVRKSKFCPYDIFQLIMKT